MTKHLPLIVLTALALAGCGGSDNFCRQGANR